MNKILLLTAAIALTLITFAVVNHKTVGLTTEPECTDCHHHERLTL